MSGTQFQPARTFGTVQNATYTGTLTPFGGQFVTRGGKIHGA